MSRKDFSYNDGMHDHEVIIRKRDNKYTITIDGYPYVVEQVKQLNSGEIEFVLDGKTFRSVVSTALNLATPDSSINSLIDLSAAISIRESVSKNSRPSFSASNFPFALVELGLTNSATKSDLTANLFPVDR